MFKMISTSAAVLAFVALASPSYAGTCQGSKYKQTSAQAACSSAQERTAYRPVQTDIVDTAAGADNFKTLVAAVQAAGLVDALKGKGPFTVFAPTDEAFAKLPKGTVEALLKDKEKLAKILTYHVVKGNVTSKDVAKLNSAGSLQGGLLHIDASKGVRVNDAKVVTADLRASNGIIHVIDITDGLLPVGSVGHRIKWRSDNDHHAIQASLNDGSPSAVVRSALAPRPENRDHDTTRNAHLLDRRHRIHRRTAAAAAGESRCSCSMSHTASGESGEPRV